jgi:hypothetical protein
VHDPHAPLCFEFWCRSLLYIRFFVVVALALVVNLVISAFVAQRRASGAYPRFLLNLIEDMDRDFVLKSLG